MMQGSMVTNNSMMRDSAGASPVPDKERNPSMRSKALGGLLAAALSLSPAVAIGVQTAYAAGGDMAATEYTLYPKPHSIRYDSGQYILRDINVIYDDDIDEATQDRLDEVAALKNLNVTESDAAVSGKTNVYVGVNGSDGKAETAIESKYSPDSAIFDKTDSYFLKSDNGTISVLGKDTDASFYGLTTLYQVLGQIDSLTIRNFTVTDYADVVSRGFIEGYYGNPWSTQDRINLMKWGGYYKLNSYFYAPKDDPKHNSQWRTLYTQDELDTKIKPLADAGNASKTRFVFALHPFMNNAIRFNSEANYQADLKVLQDKFAQTIGVGVRQIAILADDAANVGGNNYTKLLTDMVAWLKEMKKTYPDLKTTLPFVTQEYMGNGMSYFANFPKEVQIVMTGGRVWGEVSQNFTDTFTSNVGRGPYMWINWPCSDNSKSHLIMGGYDTFLHPGVDPSKIQGIVLNPMQQSEPSKVGIFGNATYSWNIWRSKSEADQAWQDSFSFVDHNSAVPTAASNALRELSKHTINQNMDSRVTALQESVDLAPALTAAKAKLADGTITAHDLTDIKAAFVTLQKAAKTYRAKGDAKMLGDIGKDYTGQDANEQIAPWIDCWDDTTKAALAYIAGIEAALNGDTSSTLKEYSDAQSAFAASKKHGFYYVNHTEYAEVGVQHIVPFIKAMDSYLSNKVQQEADPNVVTKTYISDVFTTPTSGSIEDIFDGKDSTVTVFQNPNYLHKGNYVGVKFSKATTLKSIRFAFNGGKNHFYHSKLQTTTDGENWTDVPDATFERPKGSEEPIKVTGLNITGVTGVRLIATADNGDDLWLGIKGIDVNKVEKETLAPYTATGVQLENLNATYSSTKEQMIDGNPSTITYLKDPNGDKIAAGAAVIVDLGSSKPIGEVTITGHASSPDDRPSQGVVEVSDDKATWTKLGDLRDDVTSTVSGNVTGRYVRIRNTAAKNVWWRVAEITVTPPETADPLKSVYTNKTQHGYTATLGANTAELFDASHTMLDGGQYAGLDLLAIRDLTDVELNTGNANPSLQISDNGLVWTTVEPGNLTGKTARYVRVINGTDGAAFSVNKLKVGFSTVGKFGKLVSSDIQKRNDWGTDTRESGNAFDGDMTTVIKFAGQPRQGNIAVFDLGQPIDITSLRIYTQDTQYDYIRDTKVQMSVDGKTWVDAFEIGDGVSDTDTTTAFGDISDTNKKTDSNYPNVFYYGKDDIANGTGMRYLRLLTTADYPQRALAFNEFMVNQGAYVSTEANAAFSATKVEERGHAPSNMIDGDLTTTYKPSAANGSLTYKIDDPSDIKSFRIVQSGAASGATVTGTVYDAATGTTAGVTARAAARSTSEVTFGTLEQAINEFKMPDGKQLLSVKIAWGDAIPEISEFITLDSADTDADITTAKAALKAKIDATVDTSAWTANAKTAYDEAKATAQAVYGSPLVGKASIDAAASAVQSAIDAAQTKADAAAVAALRKLVDEAVTNDGHFYTTVTFTAYTDALDEVKEALKDTNNLSTADAASLKKAVDDALAALKDSTYQRELATIAVDSFATIDEADYTTNSYAAFKAAKEALDALIAADGTKPAAFKTKTADYTTAKTALVNVAALKAQIAHESNYVEANYTADSWKAYSDALKAAKAKLVNGTTDSVAAALTALTAAENALVRTTTPPDTTVLDETIADMEKVNGSEYTTDSYKALTDAIAKAKSDKVKGDAGLNQQNIDAMKAAKEALVSTVELKAKVAEAGKVDSSKYTTASYGVLSKLLAAKDDTTSDPVVKGLDTLYKSGTVKELAERVAAIDAAVAKLDARATGVKDYVDGIKLKDNDKGYYTDASYKAYSDAYKALKKLAAAGEGEVGIAEFTEAKEAFEAAEAKLAYKSADYGKIDDLLAKVPSDLSGYTADSVAKFEAAKKAVKRGLTIDQQSKVDAMADALEAAIKGLTLKSQAPGGNKGDGTQSGTHKGDDISKTGADVQVFAIIIALATCAGLGAMAYARRRREA